MNKLNYSMLLVGWCLWGGFISPLKAAEAGLPAELAAGSVAELGAQLESEPVAELGSQQQSVQAQLLLDTVKQQLQRVHWHHWQSDGNWAYTVETQLDNGNTEHKIQHTKQRFDPSLPAAQQWQLLEFDFAAPTAKNLAEYRHRQQSVEQSSPHEEQQAARSALQQLELVDLSTLQFSEQNGQQQLLLFRPKLPMFEQQVQQLFSGVLSFDLQQQRVTSLYIELQQSFSPRLSFTIKQYRLHIRLEQIDGELHMVAVDKHIVGSAFWLTDYDEKSSKVFSDFNRSD